MNIFVTSECPIECASALDNKRVIKMTLESTQMLCTALNELAGEQITQYKSTHVNHPCNIWARTSWNNWRWLYAHAMALATEYHKRYGKIHKCLGVLHRLYSIAVAHVSLFNRIDQTPFANCARNKNLDIDYTHIDDIYFAYQLYLNDRWDTDKRQPKWESKV